MNSIKKILSPPVFEEEEKMQQAYLLNSILWVLVCVPIPYLIYTVVVTPEYLARALVQALFGETVNILLLAAVRRGHVRAASIIQVGAFWLFFTVTAATGNGVQGEAYLLGYGLVIVIAGLLLGGAGALVLTALSLLAGAGMVYGYEAGVIGGNAASSPLTTWFVSLLLFPVGAVLEYLGARTMREFLARARASEEKYRLISAASSDYSFSTELNTEGRMRLDWVAGAFEKITGYASLEEYVAEGGWQGHLHPEDAHIDEEAFQRLSQKRSTMIDVRTLRKDGEIAWVRVHAHPVWDEKQNRLKGIAGGVRDITTQKQAEDDLRVSEAIYRQAIEVAGAVPYHQIYLPNGKVVYDFIGAGIYELTGYRPRDFNEALWDSLVLERQLLDELAEIPFDDAILRVRSGEKPIWKCEHLIQARDGKHRWVFEAAVELRDKHGVSHGSVGLFQDITERKLAEERQTRQRAMLEKLIRLGQQVTEVGTLKPTLEKIWHGVHDELGFDRLAIFLYNEHTNTIHGTLGTDNQGHIVEEWEYVRPLSEEQPNSFVRILQEPDGAYLTHEFWKEYEIPEGHEMYGVTDFAAVAAWAGNKPVAIIVVDNLPSQRPITEEHLEALRLFGGYAGLAIENARLNSALQEELAHNQSFIKELEAKNMELERFTYSVSHDLKSPLVTITGFLGFLEKDALEGNRERIKASTSRILSAAQRMQRLLNELLELSRIGRLMNAPETLPFGKIVEEALEQVRGRLDGAGAVVEVQEDLPLVHGDRIRLVEVIQNLVENAVKYSRPGTQPHIQIGTKPEASDPAVFFVKDNGIGIAPQFHDKIFGLFDKLDPTAEGTGVGLTLVKRIVEVHGGTIWLESQPGEGTTFYFTLPGTPDKE